MNNELESVYEEIDCWSTENLLNKIDDNLLVVLINDPEICMINGGQTEYAKDKEGYYNFSWGSGWRDQVRTYISKDKMIEYLERAIKSVEQSYDEYGEDTVDTKAAYISIQEKESEDFL